MKIALTGHRTEFFPEDSNFVKLVEERFRYCLVQLQPDLVISGACYGFDIIGANVALKNDVPVELYLPFKDFGVNWNQGNKNDLRKLKAEADKIRNVQEEYTWDCFHARDRAMVDDGDVVFALLHPEAKKGGTFYTCRYALQNKVSCFNLWDDSYLEDFDKWVASETIFR